MLRRVNDGFSLSSIVKEITLTGHPGRAIVALREWEPERMAHLIDKHLIERANTALLLGIIWGALGICVLGALAYDIRSWFEGW
ncbi:MAG: hypothetical protein ACM3JD_19885 [Rudaea sp.]